MRLFPPTVRLRAAAVMSASFLALIQAAPARAADEKQAPPAAEASSPPAPSEATRPEAPGNVVPPAPPQPDGAKHVIYLPESFKTELREAIKQEVLAEAKREGWAAPNVLPDWVGRLKLSGDVRTRLERDLFGSGNAVGQFVDFNSINNNGPWNFNDVSTDRYFNVDTPRTRPRLRSRLGVDADVTPGVTAGLRLGSGEQAAPAYSNQTLGASGGFFSKYQFWLDRAFIRFAAPGETLSLVLGRFENPFFATDLIWSDIVNFDGLAVKAMARLDGGFSPFLAAGAFPLYTTAFNYPGYSQGKYGAFNKWLYAGQVGTRWKPSEAFALKLGAAFYYFHNVEGHIGDPCDTSLKYLACDTDDSRPPFAQRGNTYMALRRDSGVAPPGSAMYQFFGLAARFRELAFTGRAEVQVAPPLKVTFDGEFVRNVGLSKKQVTPVAVNNCAELADGQCAKFVGGGDGYLGRVTFGSPTQQRQWDWNAGFAYRYLESDAVVDAFTDPDFGLGGTNLKGYILGAAVAVFDNVWTAARWMSADQIAGPPFRSDVWMLDVSTTF